MDVRAILARQSVMESQRSHFVSQWDEIQQRLFPRGGSFQTTLSPGAKRNLRQFDAFPLLALHKYAAAMDAGLTPRSTLWHHLKTGEDQIDELPDVKVFLETLNQKLWDARYAPRANFSGQNNEQFMAAGAFGNGVVFIEADTSPVGGTRYSVIQLEQLFLAEDPYGRIDTVHRKFTMSARNIAGKFDQPDDQVPDKVAKAIEDDKAFQEFEILHVVMPRLEYKRGNLDKTGQKFTDIYIDLDSKELIRDRGFYEMPYAINRPSVMPGEVYGRGPGMMLLPDIKMLQEMRRTVIEAAQLQVDKPILLPHSGILHEFRNVAGGRNYGGLDSDGKPAAVPFDNQARVDIGMDMITDTRQQIDDAMLGAYFRVLLENPQMTATQAMLVAQQQGQMVAPAVGAAQSGYLNVMIQRESGILFRQGKHPPMPPALAEYMQTERRNMGIEYESPMTRAAQSEESVAFLRAFETLSPYAQVAGPQVLDKYNPDKVADMVNRVNGVPASVMRSDEELQGVRDEQRQAAEVSTLLEAAPVAAQTIESLTRAQRESGAVPAVPA